MAKLRAIALGMSLTAAGWPCCSVTFDNNGVVFAGQANVVIWDADSKTEHFIRQAGFSTDAKDFGFIAPTPTVPELATANTTIFSSLDSLAPTRIGCGKSSLPTDAAAAAGDDASVEVVQVKDVGAYRATTLRADDARALAAWMRTNKYATSPSIEKWTEFYIDKRWYLTAFKIRAGAERHAETIPVRMSFKTERPFNPYFVPKDNIGENNGFGLILFFVSKGTYRSQVPRGGRELFPEWRERLTPDALTSLREGLGHDLKEVSEGWEVARFTDRDFPQESSDDLYFSYIGPSRWTWTPARIAIDATAVLIIGGALVWWRKRRLQRL